MSKSNLKSELIEIGPNFWNIRGRFVIKKLIDIGNQMSIVRLSNGRFLIIDAIPLTDKLKKEIDDLTENGTKIEAVIATHPFHTLAIPAFHDAYPNPPYYGCPRHIRKFPTINWAGELNNCKVQSLWEPDIEMRIPAGSEFVSPLPENDNHFSCVWVFHKASGTIHIDDTILYSPDPGLLLSLGGFKKGTMTFHTSFKTVGLLPHPDAPYQFRDWVNQILKDWEFDNIVAAHMGNKLGGAKAQLQDTLSNADEVLKDLTERRHKKTPVDLPAEGSGLTSKDSNECG